MSWMKEQAAKAKAIHLTAEDEARADAAKSNTPRTAPGQLMLLQATVGKQKEEIENLKAALKNAAVVRLPVARLHEVPGRRRKLTPEARAELKANLSQYPLSQPISVVPRPDGDWDVVAGNNRVDIYRELDREEIEGVVLQLPAEQVEMVAFFSNLLSPSLSDFEKYWNFKRLQEGTSLTRQELAEAAGLAKSHVSRIFSFEGLPDEAKEILAEKPERLGSHAAAKLAAAATEGRAEAVIEAIRRLVEDEKFTQEAAVKLLAKKPEPQKKDAPLVVRVGKARFCEITERNGVIGVRLSDAAAGNEWAKKIQQFIESELRE